MKTGEVKSPGEGKPLGTGIAMIIVRQDSRPSIGFLSTSSSSASAIQSPLSDAGCFHLRGRTFSRSLGGCMMSPHTRKNILVAALVLVAIALCLVFPRMRLFSQIFMREFRFLWWLLLLAGIAIYFSVIRGRRNKR